MTSSPQIHIVIVTWNGKHLIERLVESLEKSDRPCERIVVVDNASSDGTVEMLADRFPRIEVIRMEKNIGYSAGINVGLKRVKEKGAQYVWVFNNDVVVKPDCLAKLVDTIESDPQIGVVGPIVFDYKTKQIAHAGYRINMWTGGMKEIGTPPGDEPYEVDSAFGCSNLIRMEAVERIGGFDDGYNVYFDETDFNSRARRDGWKVVVEPRAGVYHEESATMNRMIMKKGLLLLRNLVRFEVKNAGPLRLTVFFPYFLLIHIPQFLVRGAWYALKVGRESRRN